MHEARRRPVQRNPRNPAYCETGHNPISGEHLVYANKDELLRVLQRPEIPLHTNGSENDIRCQVTRRKISAGTRSDLGRDCRDAFLGLAKTCTKLGVAFWDYLGSRLGVPGQPVIPPLPTLIRRRQKPA